MYMLKGCHNHRTKVLVHLQVGELPSCLVRLFVFEPGVDKAVAFEVGRASSGPKNLSQPETGQKVHRVVHQTKSQSEEAEDAVHSRPMNHPSFETRMRH